MMQRRYGNLLIQDNRCYVLCTLIEKAGLNVQ